MSRARDIANIINSGTFITPASVSSTYLSQSSASTTYLAQSSASTTYLAQSSASTTYLAQSSASTTYLPLSGGSISGNLAVSGNLTNPARIVFSAQHTGGTVANGAAFIFTVINTNIGSAYNSTNGRFTAPVAGVYYFSFGFLSQNSNVQIDFRFRKNGTTNFGGGYSGDSVASYKQGHGSAAIYLAVNDYVECISFNTSYVHPDAPHNVFSGFFIG